MYVCNYRVILLSKYDELVISFIHFRQHTTNSSLYFFYYTFNTTISLLRVFSSVDIFDFLLTIHLISRPPRLVTLKTEQTHRHEWLFVCSLNSSFFLPFLLFIWLLHFTLCCKFCEGGGGRSTNKKNKLTNDRKERFDAQILNEWSPRYVF